MNCKCLYRGRGFVLNRYIRYYKASDWLSIICIDSIDFAFNTVNDTFCLYCCRPSNTFTPRVTLKNAKDRSSPDLPMPDRTKPFC